jgi:hypothetical protein
MRGRTITWVCGLSILGLLTACSGQARPAANPYEREQALRATGNGVSSFRAPEQPQELWRVEVDGFKRDDAAILGSVTGFKLCQDGSLGVEISADETSDLLNGTYGNSHRYYAIVQDRSVVAECYAPESKDDSGWGTTALIPSAPPLILTGLMFGQGPNPAEAGNISESSNDFFRLAAYDLSPTLLWEKTHEASAADDPAWFYADSQFAMLAHDRLYSTGSHAANLHNCYLCFNLQGDLQWAYDFPMDSTYWGGSDDQLIMHPALSNKETLYISCKSKVLALNGSGKLVAEFDENMQCGRQDPIVGLDGKVYLVALEAPAEAELERIDMRSQTYYELLWQQDEYLVVLNDQLVEERRSLITEGWQMLVCIDLQGNYTMYLNKKPYSHSDTSETQNAFLVRYNNHDIEQWRYELSGIAALGRSLLDTVLDAEGRILVLTSGGLVCLSPDGAEMWKYVADQQLCEFVLGGDGLIYCVADSSPNANVTAQQDPTADPAITQASGVIVYAIGDPGAAS